MRLAIERVQDLPAPPSTARQSLTERLAHERPGGRPDHQVIAVDERDRPAGERDHPPQPVERRLEDPIEIEFPGRRGRDLEHELGHRVAAIGLERKRERAVPVGLGVHHRGHPTRLPETSGGLIIPPGFAAMISTRVPNLSPPLLWDRGRLWMSRGIELVDKYIDAMAALAETPGMSVGTSERAKAALRRPTAIELFAGVGGFHLALHDAEIDVVWANQWEPATKTQHAAACLVTNIEAGKLGAHEVVPSRHRARPGRGIVDGT